jgi:hypothetical protein
VLKRAARMVASAFSYYGDLPSSLFTFQTGGTMISIKKEVDVEVVVLVLV